MDKILQQAIASDQMITWLVMAFLFGYFIYKEWPEFKRRVSGSVIKENTEKTVCDRLTAIESDIREIKEKLGNDYSRLNDIDVWKEDMEQFTQESLEEREVIMQALLGVLGGLQEIGAKGPTKDAKAKVEKYINKQAHRREL